MPYSYHVTWSENDGAYIGWCPEFPALIPHVAKNADDAFAGAKALVANHVAQLQSQPAVISAAGGGRIKLARH